jgi:hypothetical protein
MPNNSNFILRLEQVHENNPTKKTTYDNESSFIIFSLYMSKSSESKLSCWIKILKIYQLFGSNLLKLPRYYNTRYHILAILDILSILDATFWLHYIFWVY